jgi:hypothetical protein
VKTKQQFLFDIGKLCNRSCLLYSKYLVVKLDPQTISTISISKTTQQQCLLPIDEQELNMIENINDNTAGVANFVVNLFKHDLKDISNDVKIHKQMYKNGLT